MESLKTFVESVPDHRRTNKGNIRYKLKDVLILVITARLRRCITRCDIIKYGEHNLKKFQSEGLLLNGVPSEPTLCRMSKEIDSLEMANQLAAFITPFHKRAVGNEPDIICLDGKAMRGTEYENGRNPDIVSAYSCKTGLVLATEICKEKSNEITAVPKLISWTYTRPT